MRYTIRRLWRLIPFSFACLTVMSCAPSHSAFESSGAIDFTVPGVDDVPDLHGDPDRPDLVIFFGGNEFMVLPDLLAAFRKQHPRYRRIFCETLPPGVIGEQIDKGRLVIGNLEITVRPDVVTAGKDRIMKMERSGRVKDATPYAGNTLAIMVKAGNPKQVKGFRDLARDDVRVSLPDSSIEDIGKKVEKALEESGGQGLTTAVLQTKVRAGTTFITRIHHRQTPRRILAGESDAGPVWLTEALFQQSAGNPLEPVEVPETETTTSTSFAAALTGAPHPEGARDFLNFITSDEAQAIFKRFGFRKPE
jgi:ABC-type molybdate transport system substrate-binding protein